MKIDYTLIPEHCRDGMRQWIEQGEQPGDFLSAVLCNNLSRAVGRADGVNRAALHNYVKFLYNDIPSAAWGSWEACRAWAARFGKDFRG